MRAVYVPHRDWSVPTAVGSGCRGGGGRAALGGVEEGVFLGVAVKPEKVPSHQACASDDGGLAGAERRGGQGREGVQHHK